ncbi:FkbM family methyltransferase [Planctomycetota bacterium]|nr:FkbM family methyltransferase [Planctomycetota bacterium]
MGIVSKKLGQAWDRISRFSGRRVPNYRSESFSPVVITSHGSCEVEIMVSALESGGEVYFPEYAASLPRLVKLLQRHSHRSWNYLSGMCAELAGMDADSTVQLKQRMRVVPRPKHSLASCLNALYAGDNARWGCKADLNVNRVTSLLGCFPDARIICAYRNGMDAVAAEMASSPNSSVIRQGNGWSDSCVGIQRMADRFPDSVLLLKYEALITDPASELARVCEFIGTEPTPAMEDAVSQFIGDKREAVRRTGEGERTLGAFRLKEFSPAFSRELVRLGYEDVSYNGPRFHSQFGQDKYVAEALFPGKTDGFFVDIGAHDGVTYSNSKYFEELGWRGVCVEPNPQVFCELRANRNCECVNACISEVSGELEFATVRSQSESDYTNMLSGIVGRYDKRHWQRFENEVAANGGTIETIKVASQTFNECVPPGAQVDFVSIDTEGAEIAVLQSIDFSAVDIKYFVIENNFKENTIADFMGTKGYVLKTTIHVDQVFERKQD